MQFFWTKLRNYSLINELQEVSAADEVLSAKDKKKGNLFFIQKFNYT